MVTPISGTNRTEWAGVPVVVTFHDLRVPYLFPKAGRLRPAAVTHLARAAAGVIATDPADEAELKQRDMLKDTLVIWGGEFGRTPTVELPTPQYRHSSR